MIYCVEDDAAIRNLMIYALGTAGFEAKGFEDGAAMFEALKTEKPQMVMLDIMLPGEDGISILKKLRARGDTRRVPVVMTTARGEEYDKVLALDLGALELLPGIGGMGGNLILRLQHGLLTGNGHDGRAVLPRRGDAAGDDVLRHHRANRVVHQHQIVRGIVLFQLEHAVSDAALAVCAAGNDVPELGNAVLARIGRQNGIPALDAHHGDHVHVRVLLKRLET